jgi:hypothetical protein
MIYKSFKITVIADSVVRMFSNLAECFQLNKAFEGPGSLKNKKGVWFFELTFYVTNDEILKC